jgi:membrane protein
VGPAITFFLKLLPYVLLWILYTFLYMFIPNTKVNFTSALLAGVIAGTLHGVFQRFYIVFQVGVSKYNAVYGSFAALPLFFVWLQFSWLIVLLCAEVAFAHQNLDIVRSDKEIRAASYSFKRLISLHVTQFLVQQFSGSKATWSVSELSRALEIPTRLVNQILSELVDAGVISKVALDEEGINGYQPARDPDTLTIKYVIDALEKNGIDDIPVGRSKALDSLSENLKVFSDTIEASPANRRLKDI